MARRKHEEEHAGNHERWLLTYADLITLLMIFFILMYTMANIDQKKFAALQASLSEAFIGEKTAKIIGDAAGPSFIEGVGKPGDKDDKKRLDDAEKKLRAQIKKQGLEDKVKLSQEERGLVISLKEALLFDLGSAQVKPEARLVIIKIGSVLKILPNAIRIEGHTDNLPISTHEFPSNWELSTTRATNVVKVLVTAAKYPPGLLSATGYGEFRPLSLNTNNTNRQRNRRVDIIVVRSTFNNSEPTTINKTLNRDAAINDKAPHGDVDITENHN
jgi:chemotaxis protein MotB